jgi:hypothetical protein
MEGQKKILEATYTAPSCSPKFPLITHRKMRSLQGNDFTRMVDSPEYAVTASSTCAKLSLGVRYGAGMDLLPSFSSQDTV